MKVVHVNTTDNQGGAARAAYRLHRALLDASIDSKMLVQVKSLDDYTVIGAQNNLQKAASFLRPFLDSLPTKLYKKQASLPFSTAWAPYNGMVQRINALSPDIVHLHWIGNGMIRIEEIAKIQAPIVWTMHDSWAFTGGCHVRWECNKYKNKCGSCPILASNKEYDLSTSVFKRKETVYAKIKNLTITGPSRWISSCASESHLLKSRKVINLPIPLDTLLFSPIEKHNARSILNLPKNKKLILFGAKSATTDVNKGFKQLVEGINKLNNNDVELLIFGSSKPKESQGLKLKTHYLGHLHDEISLKLVYNAADVMIVPSIQETFGQTASEAMSCGTPVVAFGTTGLLDIVDHKINGYLAQPFDTDDLAYGIEWILLHPNYEELSKNSRHKVLSSFDSKFVTKNYIDLYKNIISK